MWKRLASIPWYVVGGGDNTQNVTTGTEFASLLPRDGATLPGNQPVDFTWAAVQRAAFYRLEVENQAGRLILSAVLKSASRSYRAPSWFKDKAGADTLHWRVTALDQTGTVIGTTPQRVLRLSPVR